MERRKNTIQKTWLRSIAKHLISKQPIQEERRNAKNNTSVRSVGNYSFAQSDFTERQ